MIINGANFNNVSGIGLINSASHKKNGAGGVPGLPFNKRFDTFKLNDTLKKYADAGRNGTDISEIRKMLSDVNKGGKADTLLGGLAAYSNMSWSLAIAGVKIAGKQYEMYKCQEEKAYYQGLLEEKCDCSPGFEPLDLDAYDKIELTEEDIQHLKELNEDLNVKIEMREYKFECCCTGNREEIEQALADVQSRIDKIIDETKGMLSERYSKDFYNKCAERFSSAFGEGKDGYPDGFGYDDLFGDMELTEENFMQVTHERRENLHKAGHSLSRSFDNWLDNIRHHKGGAELAKTILKILDKIWGPEYKDIGDVLDILDQMEEENSKAKQNDKIE